MIKFKFNEERDIINAVESNLVDFSNPRKAIWTLALYYVTLKHIDDKNAFNYIKEYMEAHDSNFYYEQYLVDINKCINKAKKYEIKNIDRILITKSEMDIIQSFDDIKKEKIVFVLVALTKYFNALYGNDRDCCFVTTRDLFKYARVVISASERDYYLSFAYEAGVLVPNFSIGSNMQSVGIISHDKDDKVVLTLDQYDYQELAYAYLNFKNGGYKRCKECGSWFKTKTSEPAALYCHLHKPRASKPLEYKKKLCIDCGREFYTSNKDNKSIRCEICQHEKQLEYQRISMQKSRNVK